MARDTRTYIRLHDGMPEHPKVIGLSDAAFRGYITLLCSTSETSGQVSSEQFSALAPRVRRRLLKDGLIEPDTLTLWGWLGSSRLGCRDRISDLVRFAVYERDRRACRVCGAAEPLSLDHIWPWSLGGEDTVENLQTLCVPCNCRKGARV